jgi:hypothetical protein
MRLGLKPPIVAAETEAAASAIALAVSQRNVFIVSPQSGAWNAIGAGKRGRGEWLQNSD